MKKEQRPALQGSPSRRQRGCLFHLYNTSTRPRLHLQQSMFVAPRCCVFKTFRLIERLSGNGYVERNSL